jgi:hypothetical protein
LFASSAVPAIFSPTKDHERGPLLSPLFLESFEYLKIKANANGTDGLLAVRAWQGNKNTTLASELEKPALFTDKPKGW